MSGPGSTTRVWRESAAIVAAMSGLEPLIMNARPHSPMSAYVSEVSTTEAPRSHSRYSMYLSRCVPSIHQVVAARDKRGVVGGKEGNEVGYLFRGSQAPQGMQRGYLRLGLRGKVRFQEGRGDEAGPTALMRTPSAACSRAAALVKPTTPCLEATYAGEFSIPTLPRTDAMLTIEPPPARDMGPISARMQ
jgi:hypothetical protein